MYQQVHDPVGGSLGLSTLVAILPLLTLFVLLGGLKLKAHLAKRGFSDIEVIVSGGYSPTETAEDSVVVRAAAAALDKAGVPYSLFPRRAGSWPGVVFTGPPLKMAAGHYGLGRGGGAHAPDEWLLIDSSDPKVAGFEGQAVAFADYLYEVARAAR